MIRAGELREKITIERATQVQQPDLSWETTWNPIHQTFASVTEKKPSVDVIAQQENIQMLIEIKIRYNPTVSILIGDRIEWRGFYFTSMAPKVDPLRRGIVFMAHSEIEKTER